MKYAIIKIAGKQYKISEGKKILVDKLNDEKLDVLFVRDGDKVFIGKPYLSKASVKFDKDEVVKGKKIDILKYKSKSRYRKHMGFRPKYTPLTIKSISL